MTKEIIMSNEKAGVNPLAKIPVGQLVAEHPERARVFEQYNIDYCCGGKMTLGEICVQKGLNVDEVLDQLAVEDAKEYLGGESDWTKTSLNELIEHIVCCYHQPLREELPRLGQLAEKVAKVHGGTHPEMVQLFNIFKTFRVQLELHMQKEEMILFPGILGIEAGGMSNGFGCGGGGIEHPIEMMMLEHDDAGEAIAKMRSLSNNYTPPDDACNTFRVLLHSLAKMELDMHQHVHKENNILFPRTLELAKPAMNPTCK
jgi:regulator of cell morphogenesis and NO signaling